MTSITFNTVAMDKPTISDILKELIRKKGLNASELARRIGLPQPTIQRMMTGTHSRPHQKTLAVIANYFGITTDQLCGIEPIPWLFDKINLLARSVPILTEDQAIVWPDVTAKNLQQVVVDQSVGKLVYAMKMPDASMEPLIPAEGILIIDPDKKPQYKSFVCVKLHNYSGTLIRQLIIDANHHYIRPLSSDLGQFEMILLKPDDIILGTVIEIRLKCED